MEYKELEVRAAEGLHEQCINLFRKYVTAESKVLDLAAGAGAFSMRLHESGYAITANDIDPKRWKPTHIPKLSLDLNSQLNSELESESFDAVVAMEVIEHLENPCKLLRDCMRLVRPGGIVMLTTPNVLDLDSRLIYLRSGFTFHISPQSFVATGHRTILPKWLLDTIIGEAGLEIVEMQWGGEVPYAGGASALRRIAWFVLKSLAQRVVRDTTEVELNSNYLVYVLQKR